LTFGVDARDLNIEPTNFFFEEVIWLRFAFTGLKQLTLKNIQPP
jgi:hypothetical protein